MRKPVDRNPFNELYLSETIDDSALYSQWFSPAILTGQTQSLFRKENTVLRGSNGVGKTMLLRLLSTQVRAAFLKTPTDFSLPASLSSSLGVNVNFMHADFGSLGRRRVRKNDVENEAEWGFLFADLLNYYIVGEILDSLITLQRDGEVVANQLNAQLDRQKLDTFAQLTCSDPCWFGALETVSQFDGFRDSIRKRIEDYRSFVNWNRKTIPAHVRKTKTSIGRPVVATWKALRAAEVVNPDIALMVSLDQYESLYHVDYRATEPARMGRTFCRVVNSLLAMRAPTVFFKIGVRHYAWGRELRGQNTDQSVERKRDYELIDLDAVLRRSENTKGWIFPKFAADVAARRIAADRGGNVGEYARWFEQRLERLDPDREIDKYCAGNVDRIREPPEAKWSSAWRSYIDELYSVSRYRAQLAEIWLNQKSARTSEPLNAPPVDVATKREWDREYWQKERREALLTQVASKCRQRKIYSGWPMLLTLSGANILIFISLCKEIWDQWQRAQSNARIPLDTISADIQSQAVRLVASEWLEKQEEFPRGATRKNFVVRLGIAIRKTLLADSTLSYPGHTGFSLVQDDWRSYRFVRQFLEDGEDYGAVVGFEHTTKERDRQPRRKWYLSPILCPNFEIPAIRTKEPYYAHVLELKAWIDEPRKGIVFGRDKVGRKGRRSERHLFNQSGTDSRQ